MAGGGMGGRFPSLLAASAGPLLLGFRLRNVNRKQAAVGKSARWPWTLLAWFIPMRSGSAATTLSLISLCRYGLRCRPRGSGLQFPPWANSLARAATILAVYFLCFGAPPYCPIAGAVRTSGRPGATTGPPAWFLDRARPAILHVIYLKFVKQAAISSWHSRRRLAPGWGSGPQPGTPRRLHWSRTLKMAAHRRLRRRQYPDIHLRSRIIARTRSPAI